MCVLCLVRYFLHNLAYLCKQSQPSPWPPMGEVCYFCLEEADEEGKPPVRDCACRGDSAGFAYLSCLVNYAERKSKAAILAEFHIPWKFCNNCKQPFQNQLAIDLSSAFVSFAETTYGHEGNNKWDRMKVMDSLRTKIAALLKNIDDSQGELLVECKSLSNQLISTVNKTKKDLNMSSWVHMPKLSEEYQYYRLMCGNYEGFTYEMLGNCVAS